MSAGTLSLQHNSGKQDHYWCVCGHTAQNFITIPGS